MVKQICLLCAILLILSGCSPTYHHTKTVPTQASTAGAETSATTVPETTGCPETTVAEEATEETSAANTDPILESSEPISIPETTAPPVTKPTETVPESTAPDCLHTSTAILNKIDATDVSEGYTGDTYCSDCGAFLSAGETTPKLKRMLTYTAPNGISYTVEEGTNITDYTMKLKTWQEEHPYAAIEQEVFYLCNLAREKYGLAPLSWNEDAYCFTKIRAQDCFTLYDHIRPNGEKWNSVFEDHGVFLYCINGENLNQASNCTASHIADTLLMADMIFASWMDSPGHRENILRSTYTSVSIAVLWSETESVCYAAQSFFGY